MVLYPNLKPFTFSNENSTRFAIYDLILNQNEYRLKLKKFTSTNIDTIFNAFRYNSDVPDKKEFIKKLEEKVEQIVKNTLIKK